MASNARPTARLSFSKLMELQEVVVAEKEEEEEEEEEEVRDGGIKTFRSIALAWAPGAGPAAFGGHVCAQAAWAASQTVASGLLLHNVTGFFPQPGRTDVPFTYRVRAVRDGGVYCLRSVEVYQPSRAQSPLLGARNRESHQIASRKDAVVTGQIRCFIATVSFKRREDVARFLDFRYQTPDPGSKHLQTIYRHVLEGKKPEDHALAPGADAAWWTRGLMMHRWPEVGERFPGVEIRHVDMAGHNRGLENANHVGKWRQLSFYRSIVDPAEDDDPVVDESSLLNLDACAHVYASDRNSIFLIARALGYEDEVVAMGTISHTVIFHCDPRALRMCDAQGRPRWFVQEAWTENGGLNRGCHESRLWKLDEEGKDEILATTKQDSLIRIGADVAVGRPMLDGTESAEPGNSERSKAKL